MKPRRLLALPAVLAIAAALVASAAAGPVAGETKLSLKLGPAPGQFSGKVKVAAPDCLPKRKVVIKRAFGDYAKVGSDKTNSQGRYEVQTNEQSGSWFAKVKPKGGCPGAKSKTRSAG
jgi:hypothetical protein